MSTDSAPETTPTADPAPSTAPWSAVAHRLGRRQFLAGLAAASVPLAVIGRGFDRSRQASHAPRQDATPGASPVASPEAMGTPGLEPATDGKIGRLRVVRDQRPAYADQPVASDQLRLLVAQGDNANYSPAALRQDFQIMVSYLDPLVWIDEVTMEPKPWLAQSWQWSADAKTITYALRPDVVWHDGDPLAAKDVVFSLVVYRDDVDSAVRNLFTTMEAAEALDDLTVKVTLTAPDGNWLLNASSQLIFQRKQYTKHWSARPEGERTLSDYNWRKKAPVGTGPWQVGKRGDAGIEFSRNGKYWAGPPHFQRLTLAWEPNSTKRLDAWKRGDTDLLWPVSAVDLASVSDAPGWLYAADAPSVMFAAFNFNNAARDPATLLADSQLRRALSLALDRPRYGTKVFGGFVHVEAAGTIAQPWAHDDTLRNPVRDVAGAKFLLKQAGWEDKNKDGFVKNAAGKRLELNLIVRNDARPELLAVVQSIVSDLKEVGIGLKIDRLAADQFRARWTTAHDFDLIAYAYNLYPGFTDFDLYGSSWDIRQNPQGWNPGGYANQEVDKAIRDALGAKDEASQRAALVRLQRAANDDLFGLWFGFPQDLILVRPDMLGFRPTKQWQTWQTRSLWRQPGGAAPLPSGTPATPPA